MQTLKQAVASSILLIFLASLIYGLLKINTCLYKGKNNMERTFAMIKPDAVAASNTGKIIDIIEKNGFTICAMQKKHLTEKQARAFYAVHKERPFFDGLVEFITSGPVVALCLEQDNAIQKWRDLMGATNPLNAEEGTMRKLFGEDVGRNAVHGSDAKETAQQELAQFFPDFM